MVALGSTASCIRPRQCAPSTPVRRSGAPLLTSGVSQNRCRAVPSLSSVFGAPKLILRRRFGEAFVITRRSSRAEVGTRVEEELKELPGDEKPKQSWHSLPSGLRLEVSKHRLETSTISDGWGEPYPQLAGAVLACSVPPTGNSAVVKRFLMSKPVASIKVTLSLAAKMFATSVSLCRETFFSPSMPESDVTHYQKLMKESSKAPLFDLRNLNSSLPVPSPVKNSPPILVVGAENDFILDRQGIEETASFLGTKEVIVPGIAHDVMLDMRWRDAADVLKSWMQTKLQSQ